MKLPNGRFIPDINWPPFDLSSKKADNILYSDFVRAFDIKNGLNVLVTQSLYNKVHSFFCQRIAPGPISNEVVQPTAKGNLGLRLDFKSSSPTAACLLLVFGEIKETITVDKNKGCDNHMDLLDQHHSLISDLKTEFPRTKGVPEICNLGQRNEEMSDIAQYHLRLSNFKGVIAKEKIPLFTQYVIEAAPCEQHSVNQQSTSQ